MFGTLGFHILPIWVVIGVTAGLGSVSAQAGEPSREFVRACTQAFEQSTVPENGPAGKSICECTAQEARQQGVTAPDLRQETRKIRKNPKYRIQNKGLLSAFQYCLVVAMKEKDRELRIESPVSVRQGSD